MENNLKKIYGIMGIIGELTGLAGLITGLRKNVFEDKSYFLLIAVLFGILIIARVIAMFKNSKLLAGLRGFNASIIKGHMSLMLGVCIMIAAIMFTYSKAFSDTIVILVITAVFMSTMLMFMIGTFDKIRNLTEENEKEE